MEEIEKLLRCGRVQIRRLIAKTDIPRRTVERKATKWRGPPRAVRVFFYEDIVKLLAQRVSTTGDGSELAERIARQVERCKRMQPKGTAAASAKRKAKVMHQAPSTAIHDVSQKSDLSTPDNSFSRGELSDNSSSDPLSSQQTKRKSKR